MKRVLEVVYGFGYGGIRTVIMNYLRYLDKGAFSVDIYVFGANTSPFTKEAEEYGARIYFEKENNAHHPYRFVQQLYAFMKEHGPYDVVHAHTNLISTWVLLAARMANVPIRLSHSHSTNHFGKSLWKNAYSLLRRVLLNHVATVKLSCGKLAGENMYGKGTGFTVIPNGIDAERFLHPDTARIEELKYILAIPKNVTVYANVTRMDAPKNHLFALEVFREIHKLDPKAIFLYGGTNPAMGSTKKAIQAKIDEYGLESFCRYTDPIMDVEQLYHLTDLWIYCSAYEGVPLGAIELQAASIPVLASDVITDEIDLGLGLVKFLSLDASPADWAREAVSMKKLQLPDNVIKAAFIQHNYDIRHNVKLLESIYK